MKSFLDKKSLINLLKCKAIKTNVCPLACVGKLVGKVLNFKLTNIKYSNF